MSKVLPLTRWKDKEFSDEEDSEDEDNEVEEFTIPLISRKQKISSGGKKAEKPRLRIPKKSARKRRAQEPPGPPPGPPPRVQGDHDISRKRRK